MTTKQNSTAAATTAAGKPESVRKPATRGFTRPQTADSLAHIEQVANSVVPLLNVKPMEAPAQHNNPAIGAAPQVIVENSEYPTVVAPLAMLKVSKWNARKYVTGIDDLAIEMEKDGQHTAAIGYYDADGKTIIIIDGQRRLYAAISKGWPGLRVELRTAPSHASDIYQISRSTNANRSGESPLDDAYMWQQLIDEGVYASQSDLIERTKFDPTLVSRTLGLNSLPKVVVRMLVEKPELLKLRMLDAIKRYCDAVQKIDPDSVENAGENLILRIEKEELSSRAVDDLRKALDKVPSKRIRSITVPILSTAGKATLKRSNDTGKLSLDINLNNTSNMEGLAGKILDFVKSELEALG